MLSLEVPADPAPLVLSANSPAAEEEALGEKAAEPPADPSFSGSSVAPPPGNIAHSIPFFPKDPAPAQ